ncbi:unnamed protein product, partial [Vitis vinifera]
MRRVLQEMKHTGCEIRRGTFLILIESYAKFELFDEAVAVVDIMEEEFGLKLDAFTYNFLLNVLVDGNKLKLVEIVNSRMVSRGIKPDVTTFNILIKALWRIEEMTDKGFLPDFSSFLMLAEGLCALSMEDTLIKLVNRVMKQANFSDSEVSMIMGFLKIRKFQDALATLGRILSSREPKKAFCIDHLAKLVRRAPGSSLDKMLVVFCILHVV